VDGDFDEKLGITNVYVLKKRVSPAFVVQSDFQEGYLAETVKPSGEMGITYKITSINEAEDSAVFVDNTGAEKGSPLIPLEFLRMKSSSSSV
jgi:hypothetical protein